MMRKIFIFLLAILLIPIVHSVGVGPPSYEYVFQPGLSDDISFYFRNNLQEPTMIEGTLEGELSQYAEITSESNLYLEYNEKGYIYISFNLPEKIETPGWHSFSIVATEKKGGEGFIAARGQIIAPVKFFVQYPGKKLDIKVDARDAGEGQDAKIKLTISNVGTDPVTGAQAKIEIFKENQKIGEVQTDLFDMDVMQKKEIDLIWNTGNNKQGEYIAKAILSYADKIELAEDKFRIGTFDLDVSDYTKEVASGTINKFFIELESKWSTDIENIFADISVLNSGKEITKLSLAEPLLASWQKKKVSGFLDASDLEVGEYPIKIDLRFSSNGETKTKIVDGKITVLKENEIKEKIAETQKEDLTKNKSAIWKFITTTNILILVVIILVIINGIFLIKKRKKKKDEYY